MTANLSIITCDDHASACLRTPSPPLTRENWDLALETADKLLYVRNTVLKGGAGLAAPQIGINLPLFIYTPDRTTENLQVVINPKCEPIGEEKVVGYEACFSVPLRCTKIHRSAKVRVKYQNREGEFIEEELDGFAAKVFQHEMDHVRGSLTIDHETAEVMTFPDESSFKEYMKSVVQEDSKRY